MHASSLASLRYHSKSAASVSGDGGEGPLIKNATPRGGIVGVLVVLIMKQESAATKHLSWIKRAKENDVVPKSLVSRQGLGYQRDCAVQISRITKSFLIEGQPRSAPV